MTPSLSISVVACCYKLPSAEMVRRLRGLFMDRSIFVTGFVVSAKHQREFDLGDGWTALPSDNLDFDFSAYLTGADAVVACGKGEQPVLFVNDTLFTDHAAQANFHAVWRQVGLIRDLELPAIAGKADPYTTVCLRNPWSGLQLYVTSFCFLLNGPGVALMRRLREFAEADGVTHEHDVDAPAWGSHLPGDFRQLIKAALVYRESAYLWYRLRTAKYSATQLRSKARAIYFEHRLSGAIGAEGCLVPSNAGPRWGTLLWLAEYIHRLFRKWF